MRSVSCMLPLASIFCISLPELLSFQNCLIRLPDRYVYGYLEYLHLFFFWQDYPASYKKQNWISCVHLLQAFFPGTEESTLYAILRRLNKEGLTEMYYSEISHGPKRKYYKITGSGEECLEDSISSWHEIINIFTQLGIV